jgi:hypothetical protein
MRDTRIEKDLYCTLYVGKMQYFLCNRASMCNMLAVDRIFSKIGLCYTFKSLESLYIFCLTYENKLLDYRCHFEE